MNKKFSLIMLFLLFFSCLSIFNSKDILASSLDEKPYFSLEEPDTLVIDKQKLYESGETELIIPSSFRNTPIHNVCNSPTIFENSLVKKIIIENGITNIDHEAFPDYYNLTEVVLPSTLSFIGTHAFHNAVSLEKINFENTVITTIEYEAFKNTFKLKNIKFPETLTEIGNQAFTNFGVLVSEPQKIYIPKSVVTFGDNIFSIESITEQAHLNRNITEIFIDTNGSYPKIKNVFKYMHLDKNLKVYINATLGNGDISNFKPSINPTSNKTYFLALGGHQVFLKNNQGGWVSLYDNSLTPPPTLEPTTETTTETTTDSTPITPSNSPILSANGQTIINIGISKDEKAPDRLSVTVPTDLVILVHAPNNEANPVDVYIGGGNKGQGQANSSINFLNSSHTSDLTPTPVEIKSATITSLGSGWQLQNFESPLTANQIAMQVNKTNLTVGTKQLNIPLSNAYIDNGEIAPIQTSVPISVKIGGNCSDYTEGQATAPTFNINWRIGKKNIA